MTPRAHARTCIRHHVRHLARRHPARRRLSMAAAVKAFRSQFFDPASKEPATFISSPEFLDGVTARARAFGRLANVGAAEGFVSPRPPLLADPLAAFDGFEKGF